jgi:hypothetical protein
MSHPGILLALAMACVVWAVISAVMIAVALDRRGIKTPLPFIGALIFRNLSRYRQVTLAETGKVGRLFYSYVVPINVALILALAALLIRTLQ